MNKINLAKIVVGIFIASVIGLFVTVAVVEPFMLIIYFGVAAFFSIIWAWATLADYYGWGNDEY